MTSLPDRSDKQTSSPEGMRRADEGVDLAVRVTAVTAAETDGLFVVLSGELGAGKTTAARYLVESLGYEHLSFVDRLWLPILDERQLDATRENLQVLGLELIESVGAAELVRQLLALSSQPFSVIDDARRVDVVEEIRRQATRPVCHIHLRAGFDTRFPRLQARDGVASEAQQRATERFATEVTIGELEPIADYVVDNVGTVDDLFRALSALIGRG